MEMFLYCGAVVAFYGTIGVFLIGRFLLSVIQYLKRNKKEDL
jgi:hypothetical protein